MSNIIQNPFYYLKNNRIAVFDLLKLYAMLSVVLDHTMQRLYGSTIQSSILYNWIYISQMPVFFFVSGYFAYKKYYLRDNISFTKQIKKLVYSLAIPFVSYTVIVSFINCDINELILCVINPQRSLWFLWVLFWIETIFLISKLIIQKINRIKFDSLALFLLFFFIIIILAEIYMLGCDYFDIKLIIYYSLFFAVGAGIYMFETKQKHLYNIKNVIVGLIISIIVITILFIRHPCFILETEDIIGMFERIIASITSIAILTIIFSLLSKNKIANQISKFGQLSLEFYFVHLLCLRFPFENVIQDNKEIITLIIFYICIVLLTFFVITLLKAIRLFDFILFGKANRLIK